METQNEAIDLTRQIDLGISRIMFLGNMVNRKTTMCCMTEDIGQIRELRVKVYQSPKEIWNQTPCKFELSYDQGKPFGSDSKSRLESIGHCIKFLEACLRDNKVVFEMTEAEKEWVTVSYNI